ncbi:hypothetical protein VTN49DRAFT_6159 [Thermomyces lanuginosus]|uniref:uncharacterized protein n=1 Tax=Thermomyces lanuginosus TaxID=5541 RepID=UPI0037441D7C
MFNPTYRLLVALDLECIQLELIEHPHSAEWLSSQNIHLTRGAAALKLPLRHGASSTERSARADVHRHGWLVGPTATLSGADPSGSSALAVWEFLARYIKFQSSTSWI